MTCVAEILLTVAAICKAVADTCDHHFDTSIFWKKNRNFWDMDVSYTKAKKVFGYKLDAWHLFMSAMIVCMIGAAIFHQPKLAWYYELIIAGTWWNIVFNTFYNKILR